MKTDEKAPSTKLLLSRAAIGAWSLEFLWSLEFGAFSRFVSKPL
jgi:hypothetical protein